MTVKLLILDGKESGVEISLDQQKIFSIGTINDSDFYLTKNKEDFKAYLTFKCINNRSALDKPQFDHMCSHEFSFESWEGLTYE